MMHPCGFGASPDAELCAPLKRLKEEHGPLRRQMNAFREAAEAIGKDPGAADWSIQMKELRTQVEAFAGELDPHSELEEGNLFPMMAKYIGRDTGPIAVMEYEHDQAKQNLRLFLEKSGAADGALSAEQAAEIAGYAIQAQTILTDHFMKEENVLFPMAESLLTGQEKQELADRFGGK